MKNIRVLLLQARQVNDAARIEERESFAVRAGLPVENMVPFDLLSGYPTLAEVQQYDALMVGGSGDYYVSKGNLPNFTAVLDLLREVAEVSHPLFASCFGFQLLVKALGGEIVYDPVGMEVGTFPVTLTEAGQQDNLFSYFPPTFRAQLGRKDKASVLPPTAVGLAHSHHCPYQAIRLPGKPIWGTQFHPELTKATNLARFKRYLDGYAALKSPDELQEMFDKFDDSPETEDLLARFIQLVFR